jgi:hypothetical protein
MEIRQRPGRGQLAVKAGGLGEGLGGGGKIAGAFLCEAQTDAGGAEAGMNFEDAGEQGLVDAIGAVGQPVEMAGIDGSEHPWLPFPPESLFERDAVAFARTHFGPGLARRQQGGQSKRESSENPRNAHTRPSG